MLSPDAHSGRSSDDNIPAVNSRAEITVSRLSFSLTASSMSRAERNCTSKAEGNCTTERRGVSIKGLVVCESFGLVSWLMLVCLPALLEAKALSVHLQDVHLVRKPVQERAGQTL